MVSLAHFYAVIELAQKITDQNTAKTAISADKYHLALF